MAATSIFSQHLHSVIWLVYYMYSTILTSPRVYGAHGNTLYCQNKKNLGHCVYCMWHVAIEALALLGPHGTQSNLTY